MIKHVKALTVWAVMVLFASEVLASNSGNTSGISYIPIKPVMVVNFGPATTGRIKYIKADIALRAEDAKSARVIELHMPLIRDSLISLLSAQQESEMLTAEGKETLRQQALKNINQRLLPELGFNAVAEVFFNNFIVQ